MNKPQTARQELFRLAIERCGDDVTARRVAEQMGCSVSTAHKNIQLLMKKGIIKNPLGKRSIILDE